MPAVGVHGLSTPNLELSVQVHCSVHKRITRYTGRRVQRAETRDRKMDGADEKYSSRRASASLQNYFTVGIPTANA